MKSGIRILLLICNFLYFSCSERKPQECSFYHWKVNLENTPPIKSALSATKTAKLYVHYFDVDLVKDKSGFDEIFPVGVINRVDTGFNRYRIIPVVFITNRVFKNSPDLTELNRKVSKLIFEISNYHFKSVPEEVQLDCDWTESTKAQFFEFIQLQQQHYQVSVTIRLHQIKYQNRTGVPPVSEGSLMLYNVGKPDDFNHNSILESSVVNDYIDKQTTYPLKLNVALPLFSQCVIKNKEGAIRLVNEADQDMFDEARDYFIKEGDLDYRVLKDTLYRGFYLFENYRIKPEIVSDKELLDSYNIVKQSRLKIRDIIFFHLDDKVLDQRHPEHLFKQLTN